MKGPCAIMPRLDTNENILPLIRKKGDVPMSTKIVINTEFGLKSTLPASEVLVLSAFSQSSKAQVTHWPEDIQKNFASLCSSTQFKGEKGELFSFNDSTGKIFIAVGLGEKAKYTLEGLRRATARIYNELSSRFAHVAIHFDGLIVKKDFYSSSLAFTESLLMSAYQFNRHKSKSKDKTLKKITLATAETKGKAKGIEQGIQEGTKIAESINLARDFVNEPPNILNSVSYAKMIEKDAAGIKGVKVKTLNKAQLKKENMNLFLSVNNASAYEARLVHLTYTPPKATKKTKHVALVGKGLTFDTGGYSLKPAGSMVGMKFDMAGSATLYGAFRAAALMGANTKITCILGLTDNAVNSLATMPDSIIKGRNGKTVEILNTDAEGRLVLADCLDYACDLRPDAIIDAATLTGACLIALGTEVCGLMSNSEKLQTQLQKAAKERDEYIWPLPIIDEFREDMKSPIADLSNTGISRFAGTPKAAAFLEEFIKYDIPWAHLDIAGVAGDQKHLPYCPRKGASGIMVRTLVEYLMNA